MTIRKVSIFFIFCMLLQLSVFAAPAGIPAANKKLASDLKMVLEEKYYGYETPGGIMVSVSGAYDRVYERELELNGSDVELEAGYGTLVFTLGNVIDFYGLLGGVSNGGVNGFSNAPEVDVRFASGDLLWGAGVNTVLLRSAKGKFTMFAGGSYREASDIEYKSATVNGIRYGESSLISSQEAEWKEWQGSLGMSIELATYYEPGGYTIYFVPYAGIKYSDVEITSLLTIESTQYHIDKAGSDQNTGMFIGAILNLGAIMSFEVEGRFIDETALTAQAHFRF